MQEIQNTVYKGEKIHKSSLHLPEGVQQWAEVHDDVVSKVCPKTVWSKNPLILSRASIGGDFLWCLLLQKVRSSGKC